MSHNVLEERRKSMSRAEKLKLWPIWRLFMTDETRHWAPEIGKECGGKITGVYYFNERLAVHLCELTPSYEMNFIESLPGTDLPSGTPEQEVERDRVQSDLREGNHDEDTKYFHQKDIDAKMCQLVCRVTKKEWKEFLEDSGWDLDRAHEKAEEAALEYIHTHGLY